jgi:hypothetical protein
MEPPLGEKSDEDAAEKGDKCSTEKDGGHNLESRHVSHYNYRCHDSHLTDLELMHGNPAHIGNFPFPLSALIWCHLEIEPIHILRAGCHFLQKLIAKVLQLRNSIDVFLWVFYCQLLAADTRTENERVDGSFTTLT